VRYVWNSFEKNCLINDKLIVSRSTICKLFADIASKSRATRITRSGYKRDKTQHYQLEKELLSLTQKSQQ